MSRQSPGTRGDNSESSVCANLTPDSLPPPGETVPHQLVRHLAPEALHHPGQDAAPQVGEDVQGDREGGHGGEVNQHQAVVDQPVGVDWSGRGARDQRYEPNISEFRQEILQCQCDEPVPVV